MACAIFTAIFTLSLYLVCGLKSKPKNEPAVEKAKKVVKQVFNKNDQAPLRDTKPVVLGLAAKEEQEKINHLQEEQEIEPENEGRIELVKEIPQAPEELSPYLAELQAKNYLHLYHYLVKNRALLENNEKAVIEKMTFSELSHIILETREAILQKVKSSIPKDHQNILFLFGRTKAGSTTTLSFLQGNKMVLNDNDYTSDNNHLEIGKHFSPSCTFLPNIQIIRDMVIVDYPSFDNTNGKVISLGMELALKALIAEYHPKILVLEMITNCACRFASAVLLGARLRRLVANATDCLLGLTHYSKDVRFNKIKEIEKQQKKARFEPSAKESFLKGNITELNKILTNNLLEGQIEEQIKRKIQEKIEELEELKQDRENQQLLPLPETKEKARLRQAIQETENIFLNKIGLENIIRFSNLEENDSLPSYFETFSKLKPIYVNHQPYLDSDIDKLLVEQFEKSLLKEIALKKNYDQFNSLEDFELSLLQSKTSLIHTILFPSNPKAGQFLHLSENNSEIVKIFYKRIVQACLKKLIHHVANLNMNLIHQLIDESGKEAFKFESLKQKQLEIQKYILDLEQVRNNDSHPSIIKSNWSEFQQKCNAMRDKNAANREVQFLLPDWIKGYLCIPIKTSDEIYKLICSEKKQEGTKLLTHYSTDYSCLLDQINDALIKLSEFKKKLS